MRRIAARAVQLCVVLFSSSLLFVPTSTSAANWLHPAFGAGGWVRQAVGMAEATGWGGTVQADEATGWGGTVQADGKVVVAGLIGRCGPSGFENVATVVRYLPDGSLDVDFGTGGIAHLDLPGSENVLVGVAETFDQKIVMAGKHFSGSGDDFLVVRLDPDGTLDASFGSGGYVILDAGGAEFALDVVAHPDGRISVVGDYESGANDDLLIARFVGDGGLDTSFGGGAGYVITSLNTGQDEAYAATLQRDGKLVVAGHSEQDAFVARFLADGSLDTGFAGSGFSVNHFGGDDWLFGVAIQEDDKIVVAGTVFPGPGLAQAVVARYLAGCRNPVRRSYRRRRRDRALGLGADQCLPGAVEWHARHGLRERRHRSTHQRCDHLHARLSRVASGWGRRPDGHVHSAHLFFLRHRGRRAR
jgi:uncharacterized delta-60 repeat protein